MIEKFLKAKHWQIFLMAFGLPFFLQFIILIFTGNDIGIMTKLSPFIMMIFIASFFGWFWSIAIGLQNKIPSGIKMKVRKFKIFFLIPIIYVLIFFVLMAFLSGGVTQATTEPGGITIVGIMSIVFPLHLLSMFGILYSLYFAAKTFKTVELQKEVKFSDFAGEFLLLWFFPLGIWVIQPKINAMFD